MVGHTPHINLAMSDFGSNNGKMLYFFPAHGSHVLQPLDVSDFGKLKKAGIIPLKVLDHNTNLPSPEINSFHIRLCLEDCYRVL